MHEVSQNQKAFLHTALDDPEAFTLVPSIPIFSAVNRACRQMISDYLLGAQVNVLVQVVDFNFHHAIAFLSLLGPKRSADFNAGEDGYAARWLQLDLTGPYTESALPNLCRWLDYIDATRSHPEELATLHRTSCCHPIDGRFHYTCDLPDQKLEFHRLRWSRPFGPGRIELHKVMDTMDVLSCFVCRPTRFKRPIINAEPGKDGILRCMHVPWWH